LKRRKKWMSKVQITRKSFLNKRRLEMIKTKEEKNVHLATQRCSQTTKTRNWTSALDQGGLLLLVGIAGVKNRAQD
jgi:hypothetical protein